MSESQANRDRPEPTHPVAPRREVADWEYQTAYIPSFQVRIPAGLHDRLSRWAEQEQKPLSDLLFATLEEAVRRRTRD
jgi:predicted HicB family RNase H-like nuclease